MPYRIVAGDPLPQRDELYRLGNSLAAGCVSETSNLHLRYISEAQVLSYEEAGTQLMVTLAIGSEETRVEPLIVDVVVSCVGFRPNDKLWQELQVHVCYATGGPMKIAAAIMSGAGGSGDCLQQTPTDKSALINVEPGFFIIGSKSYGRNSAFLLSLGFSQVKQVLDLLQES